MDFMDNQAQIKDLVRRKTRIGLYKRSLLWLMRFTYKGQLVRQSTDQLNKKPSERVCYKVVNQISKGKCLMSLKETKNGENLRIPFAT